MNPAVVVCLVLCSSTCMASAIPKDDHKTSSDRIHEKDLSSQTHFADEEHNKEYDHDAFLGEEAKTFDQLTPEESKERLGLIYDKIDTDKDGHVSEKELVEWIGHVQNRYIEKDTERQWKDHETEDNKLVWETYQKKTYGFVNEDATEFADGSYDYKDMVRRDKRRWEKADSDGDGKLTLAEFSNFLHPEEAEHMRDIVIEETLEDIDKNKDGYIDLNEYIADMWPAQEDEEPEWVKTEREQFTTFRDKNKDGRMDKQEIQDWIIPPDYDHSEAEAKHLLFESDVNRDGQLSKDEVLGKYDLFVGSQATDFGEALTRHDEF